MELAPGIDYFCPKCPIDFKELFARYTSIFGNKLDLQVSSIPSVPHMPYPGSSVGVFIFDADGKVLLGKRRGELGTGQYSVPGGKVDFGETPYEAALRETKEETNLDLVTKGVNRLQFTGVVTNDYFPDKGKQYINLYYLAHVVDSDNLKIMEPEKIESWDWYDRFSLPHPIWMHTEEMLKILYTGNHYHFKNHDING